jgi:hypothetical protein
MATMNDQSRQNKPMMMDQRGFEHRQQQQGYQLPFFNNPFPISTHAHQGGYPATAPDSLLSVDPLSKVSHVSSQPMSVATTSGQTMGGQVAHNPSNMYQNSMFDHIAASMNNLSSKGHPVTYTATGPLSTSAMPPPSAYADVNVSAPGFDSMAFAPRTYLPSTGIAHPNHMQDRRLSHPQNQPDFLGLEGNRPRQSSLGEYNKNNTLGSNYLDAIAASKGLMDMADLADATPRAEQQRTSTDGYGFPAPHSNQSSISTTGSYQSYFGSVDSNASGYSSNTDLETLTQTQPRTLPGVSGLLSNGVPAGMPPAPQSMMTQFSSKISTGTPKKHKCKICEKRFTRPSSLQTHIYSHTGEKPFICPVEGCGRHFSVVSNLRRHGKVHRNDGSSATDTGDDYTDHGSPESQASTQDSVSSYNDD